MLIQPYLFFAGDCEQAVNFYAQQLNGNIEIMMRYKDIPAEEQQNGPSNADPDSIMHARLVIGDNVIWHRMDARPTQAGRHIEGIHCRSAVRASSKVARYLTG